MLVVCREKNDSIVINDDISVVILDIRGDKVFVGVEAPPGVSVHRREMYEAVHRSKQASDGVSADFAVEESERNDSAAFNAQISAWRTSCLKLYDNARSAAHRWWNDLGEWAAPPLRDPEGPLVVSSKEIESDTKSPLDSDAEHDPTGEVLEAAPSQASEVKKRTVKKATVKKFRKASAPKKAVENAVSKKRPPSKVSSKKTSKASPRKARAAIAKELNSESTSKPAKKRITKTVEKKEAPSRRRTPK